MKYFSILFLCLSLVPLATSIAGDIEVVNSSGSKLKLLKDACTVSGGQVVLSNNGNCGTRGAGWGTGSKAKATYKDTSGATKHTYVNSFGPIGCKNATNPARTFTFTNSSNAVTCVKAKVKLR